MRIDLSPRPTAQPLEQLVDRLIFLSGGIFMFIDGIAIRASEHGLAGKVRVEVVARELLDRAVAPLASEHDEAELARAVEVLGEAIELIGRRFYADHYEDDEPVDFEQNPTMH